jgi:hypothetical protein
MADDFSKKEQTQQVFINEREKLASNISLKAGLFRLSLLLFEGGSYIFFFQQLRFKYDFEWSGEMEFKSIQ